MIADGAIDGAPSVGRSRAQFTSNSQEWNTPLEVLELVRAFDAIGLDPCSNAGSIVGAAVEWRMERDGDSLLRDWRGHGLVYVNPPYSRFLRAWTAKCAQSGAEVIACVPARTDARWWHQSAVTADAICYWRGRLRFLGAPSSAPFPSALLYFGPRVERFRDVFAAVGVTAKRGEPSRGCNVCGKPLPVSARADARYHSACRQRAYRARRRGGAA